MSKTYNLTATLNTGKNSALNDGNWSGYASTNVSSSEVGSIGRTSGPLFYATNMVFDSATLNTLRNKTINGVTLTLVITQGTDAPALVAWKYNSTSSGNTNSGAWARSNNAGTLSAGDASIATNANPSFSAGEVTTGTKTLTLKGLPQYGLVAGPYSDSRNGVWKISSATLNVTTNENDYNYTLSYNANGGSGAPSNQTGSSTGTSPYYTFTVSSTVPAKAGHTFLGWSTSSSATSASYVGGNSFTVTSSGTTTLYAVWKVNTYTISYNANGGTGAPANDTKTYNVALTVSATIPSRSGYLFQGWATSSTGTPTYRTGTNHDQNTQYTANSAATLYAIWKAANSTLSTINPSTVNIDSSSTASWDKIDDSYTYKLVITYSNAPSVTVNVAANTSSTSFSIPNTWYAYLPNSTSATATATLTTYSGSTALGSSSKTFTVAVASSIKPSISAFTAAPRSSNTTVNGWNVYVQGYSYVYLSATASAGTGASVVSYAFSGTGVSQTGTGTTANTTVIDSTGSKTYTLTVTDSRGRTASSTVSANFLAYSNPNVSSLASYRSNSSGVQADIDGTYIHSTPVFSYSAVGNNSLSVKKIEYKLHTASSWTSGVNSATSGTGYTFGGGNIDITKSYDVRCTVTDSLNNSGVLTVLVPPIVGFAVGLNNDRARFGGPVEKAGLQVDWNAEFNGVVDVTPRRCYAPLSSEGWYRVMVFDGSSSWVAGGVAFTVDITLFDWARQATRITLWGVSGSLKFDHEQSVSYAQLFDKIRYMQKDGYGYIDVHYTAVWSGSRYASCYFDVKQTHNATYTPAEFESWWTAINFTPVAPSPNGETQLALYTFAENTVSHSDTTTSGVRTIVDRNGKLVTVTVESAGGISCTQWQYTTVATLPSWAYPRNTVYPCVDAYGGNNIFAAQITTGGNVQLYPVLSNTNYYRLTCTYVTT